MDNQELRELLCLAAIGMGIYEEDLSKDDIVWSDGTNTYMNSNTEEMVTDPIGLITISGIWNPVNNKEQTLDLINEFNINLVWSDTDIKVDNWQSIYFYSAEHDNTLESKQKALGLACVMLAADIGRKKKLINKLNYKPRSIFHS